MKLKNGRIVITAILTLGVLEVVALLKGIDGTLLMFVLAAIAGLAGWTFPQPKFINK